MGVETTCHTRNMEKNIFNYYAAKIGLRDPMYLFKMNFTNLGEIEAISQKLPRFYVDVLLAYNKCKKPLNFKTISNFNVLTQPLWGNINFMANGKCLYFPEWIECNILYVRDLVDENGDFKKDDELHSMIENKRNIMSQLFMIKKYVFQKFKTFDLSNAQHVKINTMPNIFYKYKYFDVIHVKSKFYYKCIISKKVSRGNMETIWSRKFNFDNSNTVWKSVYKQKIINMDIAKLAEFNYKMLNNIVPCGKVLHKWQQNVSELCGYCGEVETFEHLIFNCKRIQTVWKTVSHCLKMNVKFKNIVCGLLASDDSRNVKFLNSVISIVAYSIFKFNNREKWNNRNNNCTLEEFIVRNIMFFRLVFQDKQIQLLEDVRYESLTEHLL